MGTLWKRNEHGHIIDRKESCFSLETSLEPVKMFKQLIIIHYCGRNVKCWSHQLSSTFCLRVMMSPSLKPSSPAFSGSKSYRAWQVGWDSLVGVELGVYLGEHLVYCCKRLIGEVIQSRRRPLHISHKRRAGWLA